MFPVDKSIDSEADVLKANRLTSWVWRRKLTLTWLRQAGEVMRYSVTRYLNKITLGLVNAFTTHIDIQ